MCTRTFSSAQPVPRRSSLPRRRRRGCGRLDRNAEPQRLQVESVRAPPPSSVPVTPQDPPMMYDPGGVRPEGRPHGARPRCWGRAARRSRACASATGSPPTSRYAPPGSPPPRGPTRPRSPRRADRRGRSGPGLRVRAPSRGPHLTASRQPARTFPHTQDPKAPRSGPGFFSGSVTPRGGGWIRPDPPPPTPKKKPDPAAPFPPGGWGEGGGSSSAAGWKRASSLFLDPQDPPH